MTADQCINQLYSPLKEVADGLRKIITNHSSQIKQEMKWNVPTYSINKNICSIMAHKNHVNLQMFRGAHIIDAQKLSGTGRDRRHLKFSSLSELKKSDVEKYLKQAIELDK